MFKVKFELNQARRQKPDAQYSYLQFQAKCPSYVDDTEDMMDVMACPQLCLPLTAFGVVGSVRDPFGVRSGSGEVPHPRLNKVILDDCVDTICCSYNFRAAIRLSTLSLFHRSALVLRRAQNWRRGVLVPFLGSLFWHLGTFNFLSETLKQTSDA